MMVLLLACSSSPEPTPEPGDSSPMPPDEVAWLSSPAPAEDLDPDPDVLHAKFTAAPATFDIAGEEVEGFAYNGQVPGPTLRAKVGDTLVVELTNALDTGTTIHWHGVRAPYAMDGATWQTEPVQSGETFTYTFELDQAGTFWYHPHFDTERQVDLGLYGMLVVEDPADPVADRELLLVFDSWGEYVPSEQEERHAGGDHGFSILEHGWTVNGLTRPPAEVLGGETVLLRMVNVSSTGYIALSGPELRQVGGEQGLLPVLHAPAPLLLGPGERAVVEALPGDEDLVFLTAPHSLAGEESLGEPEELFTLAVSEPAAASPGLPWDFQGGEVTPDPTWTDIVYTFSGDEHTGKWLINGETYPDVTLESVALNDEAIIEIRNLSPTEHPFHLHGLYFEVLSIDGEPPAFPTFEDTINVGVRQTLRLKVLADNPGYWMTHCHILPHAHGGMMTVLEVQ